MQDRITNTDVGGRGCFRSGLSGWRTYRICGPQRFRGTYVHGRVGYANPNRVLTGIFARREKRNAGRCEYIFVPDCAIAAGGSAWSIGRILSPPFFWR
jgi:hypothetical protein